MRTITPEIANKDVRRNRKYENLVEILVTKPFSIAPGHEVKLFPYIKDLIVFAAMVGKHFNKKEAVSDDNIGIAISTFAGGHSSSAKSISDQHNIIFMFGLSELRDMKYLHDEHFSEVISVFEEYSNGGLSIIEQWLLESAYKPMVIFDKMVDVVNTTKSSSFDLPVDF